MYTKKKKNPLIFLRLSLENWAAAVFQCDGTLYIVCVIYLFCFQKIWLFYFLKCFNKGHSFESRLCWKNRSKCLYLETVSPLVVAFGWTKTCLKGERNNPLSSLSHGANIISALWLQPAQSARTYACHPWQVLHQVHECQWVRLQWHL